MAIKRGLFVSIDLTKSREITQNCSSSSRVSLTLQSLYLFRSNCKITDFTAYACLGLPPTRGNESRTFPHLFTCQEWGVTLASCKVLEPCSPSDLLCSWLQSPDLLSKATSCLVVLFTIRCRMSPGIQWNWSVIHHSIKSYGQRTLKTSTAENPSLPRFLWELIILANSPYLAVPSFEMQALKT